MSAAAAEPFRILGQGLAGTCLAWCLWQRGAPFVLTDRGSGGSSRVAAGLLNPITGKQFSASWRLAEFLPEAVDFYRQCETRLGGRFWHPMPIQRLAAEPAEVEKILRKLEHPDIAPWIANVRENSSDWPLAVTLKGGGRLDTRAFLDASMRFFHEQGCLEISESAPRDDDPATISCEGAPGLMRGLLGPHRCAKGQILTLHAPSLDLPAIRIGGGGWLVPLGGGHFKAGATYEWDPLDEIPTPTGRETVETIARRLLPEPAETQITAHEAGIRPILRRSQPVAGRLPGGGWVFNAMGSKGSLYAPGVARQLAESLLDGKTIEADLSPAGLPFFQT